MHAFRVTKLTVIYCIILSFISIIIGGHW